MDPSMDDAAESTPPLSADELPSQNGRPIWPEQAGDDRDVVVAPALEFRAVRKRFWKDGVWIKALHEATFQVRPGEFVAIIGPSGCGKSTLLNMAAGIMDLTKGEIWHHGKEVRSDRVTDGIGYVTQKDNLLPWRTVAGNIGLPLELQARHVPPNERNEKVQKFVALVGLSGFENHYPYELSGGMRKRVGLARTLIYEPATLLMDEPFGALDAQLKLILKEELLRILEELKRTVLYVTHDLDEAITLADRVVVLSARPATIRMIQEIDIPRPRDVHHARYHPRFAHFHDLLWEAMAGDIRAGEEI